MRFTYFEGIAKSQDRKLLCAKLKEISDDSKRTTEEILEGTQTSTIDCGSLLGPIFIDGGPSSHDENPLPVYSLKIKGLFLQLFHLMIRENQS